jgi:hypothetical protein
LSWIAVDIDLQLQHSLEQEQKVQAAPQQLTSWGWACLLWLCEHD